MAKSKKTGSISRRGFLTTTGGLITVGPALARASAPAAGEAPLPRAAAPAPQPGRKIPIGVFTNVFCGLMDDKKIPLDDMLDFVTRVGIEALEIGMGGPDIPDYCPTEELLADPTKIGPWKKKFTDRGLLIGALGAHGNPLHPDPKMAAVSDKRHRDAILLAERAEVPVIVTMSGLPAAGPDDKFPNWIMTGYMERQAEWQWNQKAIPYWRDLAKFSREHGKIKMAIEIHAGEMCYNPETLLRLHDATDELVGANIDFSHQLWQGIYAPEAIRFLKGATYHSHMKDVYLREDVIRKTGNLVHPSGLRVAKTGVETSYYFRTVGYGHSAEYWKDIVKAYMETDFPGIMSIEMEDPMLPGLVGVERSFYTIKNVRDELLGVTPKP